MDLVQLIQVWVNGWLLGLLCCDIAPWRGCLVGFRSVILVVGVAVVEYS